MCVKVFSIFLKKNLPGKFLPRVSVADTPLWSCCQINATELSKECQLDMANIYILSWHNVYMGNVYIFRHRVFHDKSIIMDSKCDMEWCRYILCFVDNLQREIVHDGIQFVWMRSLEVRSSTQQIEVQLPFQAVNMLMVLGSW